VSKGIRGFLGSLFSSSSSNDLKEPEKKLDFDSMNIKQILKQILEYSVQKTRTSADVDVHVLFQMTERLFRCAYYDYNTSDEDRQIAEELLGSVIKDVENGLSSYPEALQSYRTANKYMIDGIELRGIGSLAWKIGAPGVSGEDVIRMIIDSTSGPLIPNFLKIMPENTWGKMKGNVIKALILDRSRNGESNAVIILSGLVAGTDLVAWNIMSPSERSVLMGVSKNYENARNVLVRYGILPNKSLAQPMTPRMDDDALAGIVLLSAHDRDDSTWPSDVVKEYDLLDENQKSFISVSLMGLKVNIFLDLINDIYGKEIAQKIENNVLNNLKEANNLGFKTLFEVIRTVEQIGLMETYEVGIDRTIAAGLMDEYVPKGVSEERQMEIWKTVSDIYNIERINSLHKFRFFLRFFASKDVDHAESLKKSGDLYRSFGSKAGGKDLLEYLEDWIGYV